MIKVGDIVSSNIHPYYSGTTNILISGEPLQLPPLMVVTEVFRKRSSVDVAWDNDSVDVSCKCVWYSSRLNKYQEDWMLLDYLKIIATTQETQLQATKGNLVALKTIYIELGKKKSSLTHEDGEDTKGYTSITSLLTFLPPVMQVISVEEFEVKKHEPLGNIEGLKVRLVPKYVVKCIWYNSDADKFSEIILPIEVLQVVETISSVIIQNIDEAIKTRRYYLTGNKLVKPQSITARSGLYFLRAYDLVQNTTIEIPILNTTTVNPTAAFLNQAPKFDADTSIMYENVQSEMITLIQDAIKNRSFLRLQYKNRNDRVTVRTLKEYKLEEYTENDKNIIFLTGYCFLRREERTFRLERIQNLQELDLTF